MNMDFGKMIYNTVVKNGVNIYKRMYEHLTGASRYEYWNDIKRFYDTLTEKEKIVFFKIVELILIDTVSHVFGILDGVCGLADGGDFEASVVINGEDMEHELQDSFLAYVEELRDSDK